MVKTTPFDTARHLDNPEVIARYLTEAFQTRDSKLILRAVQTVARAVGVQLEPIAKPPKRRRKRRQKSEFKQTMKVARKVMKKDRNALRELAKK